MKGVKQQGISRAAVKQGIGIKQGMNSPKEKKYSGPVVVGGKQEQREFQLFVPCHFRESLCSQIGLIGYAFQVTKDEMKPPNEVDQAVLCEKNRVKRTTSLLV